MPLQAGRLLPCHQPSCSSKRTAAFWDLTAIGLRHKDDLSPPGQPHPQPLCSCLHFPGLYPSSDWNNHHWFPNAQSGSRPEHLVSNLRLDPLATLHTCVLPKEARAALAVSGE